MTVTLSDAWMILIIYNNKKNFKFHFSPVRIRVRIDPPHPLVCRKRRLNGAVLLMRPEKSRSQVTAGEDKDPSLLKGSERRA
jgi:hypothetical protein